jgi:23S rRNA pseudouridine955/2504/2580 synthase
MEPAGKAAVRLEIVDESSVNQRLDNFLLKMLKGVPKSHVYRFLRRGGLRSLRSGRRNGAAASRRPSSGEGSRWDR